MICIEIEGTDVRCYHCERKGSDESQGLVDISDVQSVLREEHTEGGHGHGGGGLRASAGKRRFFLAIELRRSLTSSQSTATMVRILEITTSSIGRAGSLACILKFEAASSRSYSGFEEYQVWTLWRS